MTDEAIEKRTARMWKSEDGIIQVKYAAGIAVTLENAKELVDAGRKLAKNKKMLLLVDLTPMKSMDREARVYLSSAEVEKYVEALALITGSPISNVIGNFFIGLNKTSSPTRLFTSETKAVEWLKEFIK